MKKFYLTLMSLLVVAGAAMAGEPVETQRALIKATPFHGMQAAQAAPVFKTPAGEKKTYTVTMNASQGWGETELTGLAYDLYFDGNTVYITNMFLPALKSDVVITGTIEGNTITIPTGEFYCNDTYYGEALYVKRFLTDSMCVDSTDTPIVWTIDGDNIIDNDERGCMALCKEDGTLDCYLDDAVFEPFTLVAATPPADAIIKYYHCFMDYTFEETQSNYVVTVAIDGNDVYIKHLVGTSGHGSIEGGYVPDAWLKGTIDEDGNICLTSGQYLGVDAKGYHLFFTTCYLNEDYEFVAIDDDYTFEYDPETGNYVTRNWALTLQGSTPCYYYQEAVLYPFEYVPAKPATPEMPENHTLVDYYDWMGEYWFIFDIPMVDTEGNFIDPDSMTYSLFVDDNVFTFNPDPYTLFTEPTSEIPYFKTDWDNIIASTGCNDTHHSITLFQTGFKKLGVQSYYLVNGVKTASDIMWYYLDGTGISETDAVTKQVLSEEEYDLTGRRVTIPSNGIFVRKVTYTDGTTQTFKHLVK